MYAIILGPLDLLEWIRYSVPTIMSACSRRLYDRSVSQQDSERVQ